MKKLINFRFDEELIKQIKVCAKADDRSATNFVEKVLREYMLSVAKGDDFKFPTK